MIRQVLFVAILAASCASAGRLRPSTQRGAASVVPRWADSPWSKVTSPSLGELGPVGTYQAGCMDGAQALALNGKGYQLMRPSRRRFFGHDSLLSYLRAFTASSLEQRVGVILIGDLGQARGGPAPGGHMSHQIGLDVDVWYWLQPAAQNRFLTTEERESLSAVALADPEKLELIRDHWDSVRHPQMLRLAAERPEVERIFVNPAIKKELCSSLPASERGWLQRLRPWYLHHDHFHARLRCPAGSLNCQPQATVAPGDGCGEDLEWWFSAEGRKKNWEVIHGVSASGVEDAAPGLPTLPALCDSVLTAPVPL